MKPDELRALADEIERGENITGVNERFFLAAVGTEAEYPFDGMGRDYTANLQDAVDAVPEGYRVACLEQLDTDDGAWIASLKKRAPHGVWYEPVTWSDGATGAAALCAAILRAKAAEMEGE